MKIAIIVLLLLLSGCSSLYDYYDGGPNYGMAAPIDSGDGCGTFFMTGPNGSTFGTYMPGSFYMTGPDGATFGTWTK